MDDIFDDEEEERFSVCIGSVRLDKLPEEFHDSEEIGVQLWLDDYLAEKIHPPFDPDREQGQYVWRFNPKLCWRSSADQPRRLYIRLFDQEDDDVRLPTAAWDLPDFEILPSFQVYMIRTRHPETGAPGPAVWVDLACYTGDDEDLIEDIPLNMVAERLGELASRAVARRRFCVEAKVMRIEGDLSWLAPEERLAVEITPELPLDIRTSRIPRLTKSVAAGTPVWPGLDGLCRWTTARGSKAFMVAPRRLRCELKIMGRPGGSPDGQVLGHCSIELDAERFQNPKEGLADHGRTIFLTNLAPEDAPDVQLVCQTSCMIQEFRPEEYAGFTVAEDNGRLIVDHVDPKSEAERVGIQLGLQLLSVNDEELYTLEDYDTARLKVWLGEVFRFQFAGPIGEQLPNEGIIEMEFQEDPSNDRRPRGLRGWGQGGPVDHAGVEPPAPAAPATADEQKVVEIEKPASEKRKSIRRARPPLDWWSSDAERLLQDPGTLRVYREVLCPRDEAADGLRTEPRPTLLSARLLGASGVGEGSAQLCGLLRENPMARLAVDGVGRCLPFRGNTEHPEWPGQPALKWLLPEHPLRPGSQPAEFQGPGPECSLLFLNDQGFPLAATDTRLQQASGQLRLPLAQQDDSDSVARLELEARTLGMYDLYAVILDVLQVEIAAAEHGADGEDDRQLLVEATVLLPGDPGFPRGDPEDDPRETSPPIPVTGASSSSSKILAVGGADDEEDEAEAEELWPQPPVQPGHLRVDIRHRFPFHMAACPRALRVRVLERRRGGAAAVAAGGDDDRVLGELELPLAELLDRDREERWLSCLSAAEDAQVRLRLGVQAARVPSGAWLEFGVRPLPLPLADEAEAEEKKSATATTTDGDDQAPGSAWSASDQLQVEHLYDGHWFPVLSESIPLQALNGNDASTAAAAAPARIRLPADSLIRLRVRPHLVSRPLALAQLKGFRGSPILLFSDRALQVPHRLLRLDVRVLEDRFGGHRDFRERQLARPGTPMPPIPVDKTRQLRLEALPPGRASHVGLRLDCLQLWTSAGEVGSNRRLAVECAVDGGQRTRRLVQPEPSLDHPPTVAVAGGDAWDHAVLRLADPQGNWDWLPEATVAPGSDAPPGDYTGPKELVIRLFDPEQSQQQQPFAIARIDLTDHAEPGLHSDWVARRVPVFAVRDGQPRRQQAIGWLGAVVFLSHQARSRQPILPSSEEGLRQSVPAVVHGKRLAASIGRLGLALFYVLLALVALEFILLPRDPRAVGQHVLGPAHRYAPGFLGGDGLSLQRCAQGIDSLVSWVTSTALGRADPPSWSADLWLQKLVPDRTSVFPDGGDGVDTSWISGWLQGLDRRSPLHLEWLGVLLVGLSQAFRLTLTAIRPSLARSVRATAFFDSLFALGLGPVLLVLLSFVHRLPSRFRGAFALRLELVWMIVLVLFLGAVLQLALLSFGDGSTGNAWGPLRALKRRQTQLRFVSLVEMVLACVAAVMAIPGGAVISQFVILAGALPLLVALALDPRLEHFGRLCFLFSLAQIEQTLRTPAPLLV